MSTYCKRVEKSIFLISRVLISSTVTFFEYSRHIVITVVNCYCYTIGYTNFLTMSTIMYLMFIF